MGFLSGKFWDAVFDMAVQKIKMQIFINQVLFIVGF